MPFATLLISFFTFVELNCENLFDCQHDSLKNDTEFLPSSLRHWTKTRYWRKLDDISRSIISCGGEGRDWVIPDMVALCEVENDSVLRDLTRRSLLRNANYDYVATHSDDMRGIDVALLYSPYSFKLLSSYSLRVECLRGMRPTRDILYVKGLVMGEDTLHTFVLHAPSRYGGEKATRDYRMQVARRLCFSVDSVRSVSPDAKIIVAGDFNDYSADVSLQYLSAHELKEISADAKGMNGALGTYRYNGAWNSLDHILISPSLISQFHSCFIGDFPFAVEKDEKYGGIKPFRTYIGPRYHGGVSDHLPIIARFEW
jgi:endonuclease/exonuclease/phosphatase family metal-dependent hydrolase